MYLICFCIYPLKYALHNAYQDGKSWHDIFTILVASFLMKNGGVFTTAIIALFCYIMYKKSEFLHLKSQSFFFIFLLNTALLSHSYLETGWLITGDSNAHIARVSHLVNANKENIFYGWSNFFYGGTPVLEFYPPLFFDISAFFTQFFDSVYWGVKLTLFLSNMLSVLGMYFFLRLLRLPTRAVIVGALIYAVSFAHIHLILLRGMLPQSLIFMFLPWLFWAGHRCFIERHDNKYFYICFMALCLGGMLLSHIVTALYVFILLSVFLFTHIEVKHYKNTFVSLVIIGIIAILLAGYAIFPVFLEKQGLLMGHIPLTLFFNVPSLDELAFLLNFRKGQVGSGSITFLGYMPLVLAMIALIVYAKKEHTIRIVFVLCMISLVFKISYVREDVFLLFFISILSAYGFRFLTEKISSRLYCFVYGIVFIELFLGSIYPLARTDKMFYQDIAHYIQKHFVNKRIVVAGIQKNNQYDVSIGPNGGILGTFDIQKLDGPHNMTVPLTHNYTASLLKKVEADLNERHELTQQTIRLLCAYNVATVLIIDEANQDFRTLDTDCATPVLFSNKIMVSGQQFALSDYPVIWREDDDKETHVLFAKNALLQFEKNISPDTKSLNTIAVRNIPEHARGMNDGNIKNLSILDYVVKRNHISLHILSDSNGYIRLAHPVFHHLRVLQNDREVIPMQDTVGMMILPIEKGDTFIHIEAYNSQLRMILSYLSRGVLLIVCAYLIRVRFRENSN